MADIIDTSAEYAFEEAHGYGYDPEVTNLDRTPYARARRRAEHEDAPITFSFWTPEHEARVAQENAEFRACELTPAALAYIAACAPAKRVAA